MGVSLEIELLVDSKNQVTDAVDRLGKYGYPGGGNCKGVQESSTRHG